MPANARKRWQDVDKGQIPVENLIRDFLMYQEDRNHSPKTVKWYREMLGRFAASLGPAAVLQNLDIDAVRAYQRANRTAGGSKFSQHAYARTVKTFLRWLGPRPTSIKSSGARSSCLRCRATTTWRSKCSTTRRLSTCCRCSTRGRTWVAATGASSA